MDTENQKTNTAIADAERQESIEDVIEDAQAEIEKERDREREREREKKKAKERAKKRRLIPPFMMLLAGAVISIAMYIMRYEAKDMLVVLLCVLIVSYLVGEIYKWMLDRFEIQIEEARMEEGEVIEKEPEEADGTAMASQSGGAGNE